MFHFRVAPFRLPFPPDGHLGGFCVLTVVNSGAMKIGTCVSFQVVIFTGAQHHSSEMRGSRGPSVLRFMKEPRNVCLWLPTSIPSESGGGFPFLDLRSSAYSVCISRTVAVLMGGSSWRLSGDLP